jgi:hypothetical protein
LEKVGKETVATIVASPAISEHEFCKPALTAQSARHRAGTAGNTEARSRSGESVERFFSQEEPTEVVDAEKYGSAEPLVSLVPSLAEGRRCVVC